MSLKKFSWLMCSLIVLSMLATACAPQAASSSPEGRQGVPSAPSSTMAQWLQRQTWVPMWNTCFQTGIRRR
jgi:hypothetical protein